MPNQAAAIQVESVSGPDFHGITPAAILPLLSDPQPNLSSVPEEEIRGSGNHGCTDSTGERSAFNRSRSPFVNANESSTSPFKDGSPYKLNSYSIAHSSQPALDSTLIVSEFGPSRSPSLRHHELNRSAEGSGSPGHDLYTYNEPDLRSVPQLERNYTDIAVDTGYYEASGPQPPPSQYPAPLAVENEDGDYGDPGAPGPVDWDEDYRQTPSSMMLQRECSGNDWNDNTLAPYKEPLMFSTLEETNARLARERTAAEQERYRQFSLMRSRTSGE
jgi:hypothetical protein